ncbi:MAG TPA: hybrid sensor histidine kinase/response regulator, partial [Candidatus Competibacteraceae bacterium]|nr:hybrid sensor histidine kinase/response regulator [Candidatus Competibacteraceae bacterium]
MARPALLSTVKARLLLAFFTLAAAALVLAAVGWRGLSNTEQALQSLQQEVQPDISRSLELAERTANLAALAPYVAEASSPFQLQGEAEALRQKAREVLALARAIPHLEAAAPRLQPLLDRLEQALDELITLTRQDLFLREDLRQHLFALERLGERLAGADTAAARAPLERQLDRLVAALGADGEGLEVLQR